MGRSSEEGDASGVAEAGGTGRYKGLAVVGDERRRATLGPDVQPCPQG